MTHSSFISINQSSFISINQNTVDFKRRHRILLHQANEEFLISALGPHRVNMWAPVVIKLCVKYLCSQVFKRTLRIKAINHIEFHLIELE